ncbi:hypothetical protein BWI92_21250 [Flectobacillus sp. BAB-3569]|nr:hypothetical protein BWI92_21250 [Flectobacillus sp. BAB-3569]
MFYSNPQSISERELLGKGYIKFVKKLRTSIKYCTKVGLLHKLNRQEKRDRILMLSYNPAIDFESKFSRSQKFNCPKL